MEKLISRFRIQSGAGFRLVQKLCKMYDGDRELENARSVIQDFVFLCQKKGCI